MLNIMQECTPQLARRRNAHHTPKAVLIALAKRETRPKTDTHTVRTQRIPTSRQLNTEEQIARDNRTSRSGTHGLRGWNMNIHKLKARQLRGLLSSLNIDALADIPIASTKRGRPFNRNASWPDEAGAQRRCSRCVDHHRISDQLASTRRDIKCWIRLEVCSDYTLARGRDHIKIRWLITHTH